MKSSQHHNPCNYHYLYTFKRLGWRYSWLVPLQLDHIPAHPWESLPHDAVWMVSDPVIGSHWWSTSEVSSWCPLTYFGSIRVELGAGRAERKDKIRCITETASVRKESPVFLEPSAYWAAHRMPPEAGVLLPGLMLPFLRITPGLL